MPPSILDTFTISAWRGLTINARVFIFGDTLLVQNVHEQVCLSLVKNSRVSVQALHLESAYVGDCPFLGEIYISLTTLRLGIFSCGGLPITSGIFINRQSLLSNSFIHLCWILPITHGTYKCAQSSWTDEPFTCVLTSITDGTFTLEQQSQNFVSPTLEMWRRLPHLRHRIIAGEGFSQALRRDK